MILAVIIGSILWFLIIRFLSKHVRIFANAWGWIISWFIVVAVVYNIGGSATGIGTEIKMRKEAVRIGGTWTSSDGNIGLRSLTDDGYVEMYDNNSGFLVWVYNEDGSSNAAAFYPKTHKVIFYYNSEESESGTYKIKGLFTKKLILDMEMSGEVTYKRKSDDWNNYLEN